MSEHFYRNLLRETGLHLQIPDPERFIENPLLKVDGLPLFLMYDEAFDPDLLQVRFDLGESPEEGCEPLWRELLHHNFIWGQGGRFVFSTIADNDHVVLTLQYDISPDTTGVELGNWLRSAAYEAKAHWVDIMDTTMPKAGLGTMGGRHTSMGEAR